MNTSEREWIEKRAYGIWEEDGRPDGKSELHWQQACIAFHEQNTSAPSASRRKTKSTRKPDPIENNVATMTATTETSSPTAKRRRSK